MSVGEATVQGNWFVFGPGGQAMIGSDARAVLEKLVTSEAAVQLQKSMGSTGFRAPRRVSRPARNTALRCTERS